MAKKTCLSQSATFLKKYMNFPFGKSAQVTLNMVKCDYSQVCFLYFLNGLMIVSILLYFIHILYMHVHV